MSDDYRTGTNNRIQYHLLNIVKVNQPRFHDRVILPRLDKFKPGYNLMTINYHTLPSKYVMHSERLKTYPTETMHSKAWGDYQVAVIPIADLETIQEHAGRKIQTHEDLRRTIASFGWGHLQ